MRCIAVLCSKPFENSIAPHTTEDRYNRARHLNDVVKGYEIMTRLINDFKILPLLPFDTNAAIIFNQLQSQRIQLAKMDTRIAAIALSHELILLTRNYQHFSKISGLLIEDWTTY